MTAMDTALAEIGRAFSPAARIEFKKNHIRQLMRLAPNHPEIWTRYQRLTERYPTCNLDAAIAIVERMYRAELHGRDVAIRLWGRVSHPCMALMLLREARVVLRWMRRNDRALFDGVRDIIIMPELAEAVNTKRWEKVHNMGSTNIVLKGDGFYISFKEDFSASFFGPSFGSDDGGPETALCKDGKFHILNGDFREHYEKLMPQGFASCKAFYDQQSAHAGSSWSSSE